MPLVVSASWHVELDLFRGPLHALLALIERRELPVTRVSLVAVTDQYLALVRGSQVLDLDLAAEFLHIAARLLLLKSQALLPRVAEDDGPRDSADDEEDLEGRLFLYRCYRDAAHALAGRQEEGLCMFGRAASRSTVPAAPPRLRIEPPRLYRAARRAVTRVAAVERAGAGAPGPLVPFPQVLQAVVERLRGRRQMEFRELADEAADTVVALTMFLAVLELARRRRLALHQRRPFGPIDLVMECS